MTLSEQSAVVLEAVEQSLLKPQGIVHWADELIGSQEIQPYWLIELSTLNSQLLADYVPLLREHAEKSHSLHRRLQVVVLAYEAGLLDLVETLSKLFQLTILGPDRDRKDALDERLADALVEWDCQEELSVVELPLQAKFHALFKEYLTDAHDVASVLAWRPQRTLA